MPRKVAQVSMFDHQIEDGKLLEQLEEWDERGSALKEARDSYVEYDKLIKADILKRSLPSGKKRIRCGEFVIKITDISAGEVKSRRRARKAVKISKASA